jgi:hypothetical protein
MGEVNGDPGEGGGGAPGEDGHADSANRALLGDIYTRVGDDRLAHEIQVVREERKAANDRKKQITKSLRNLKRQRQRLKSKAKNLSTTDLVDVLCIRADAEKALLTRAAAKAQPKQAARAGP